MLLHENLVFSLAPPHVGMRQYWRDFDSLERWARSLPHRQWWQQFLRDRGSTGFLHETYFRGGQIESVYIDMPATGLARFAPVTPVLCPSRWTTRLAGTCQTGQSARLASVYEEYKKAPDVTRKRLYLETFERLLSGTDKTILDSKAWQRAAPPTPLGQGQEHK